MSLESVIKFIKNIDEKNIKFKPHSNDRIFQRNLNIETIKHYLINEEVVGLHKQNKNVYKLWFEFSSIEDLSIVVKIDNLNLIIITTIKENNIKRLKNGKK